tara:strand:- start:1281 stop:1487 length:207 start_codon:yes stop_codon:yes gene_type:complete
MSEGSDLQVCLAKITTKLERIHEDVATNSQDINSLKQEMSFGKGAVKSVVWIGSVIAVLFGLIKLFEL